MIVESPHHLLKPGIHQFESIQIQPWALRAGLWAKGWRLHPGMCIKGSQMKVKGGREKCGWQGHMLHSEPEQLAALPSILKGKT